MTNSLRQFHKNIDSINIIDSIYTYFENQVKAIDLSEIIRAQYVLLVSAFDYYIHDLIREGMLKVFDGTKIPNNDYNKFSISLKTLNLILANDDQNIRRQILDNEIRNVTSKYSFQAPANVERALALIDVKSIWKLVAKELKMNTEDIIKELGLIVNRRNKIAHEADIDSLTNEKSPIDRTTLIYVKNFIISIVTEIDKKAK